MPVFPTFDGFSTNLPDVEGMTVAQIRLKYKGSGQNDVIIIVGSQIESSDYIIQPGDEVDIITCD